MGYYSALVVFAPDGGAVAEQGVDRRPDRQPRLRPPLSYDQRTAGRDKPEATNLTTVFGYPKITIWLPADIGIEARTLLRST